MSTDTDRPTAHGPQMNRRTFVRTVGAGVGAVAAGAGADSLGYSPVGGAQAVAPAVAAGAVVVAGAAGVAAGYKWSEDDTEPDPDDAIRDQIQEVAMSVGESNKPVDEEYRALWTETTDDQNPFTDSAWSEVRATVIRAKANGKSETEAVQAAQEALDKQATRSTINIVEQANAIKKSLLEQAILQANNDATALRSDQNVVGDSSNNYTSDTTPDNGWPVMPASETDAGNYVYAKIPGDELSNALPYPPEDLPDRDEQLESIIHTDGGGSSPNERTPISGVWGISTNSGGFNWVAKVTDADDIQIADMGLYQTMLEDVETAYNNISDDLSTYVSEMYAAISQGAIDPGDVLAPSDLYDTFADAEPQNRLAGELMAVGANVPKDVGMQAEISHPDLAADRLWGWLYPEFSSGSVSLEPGMTLDSTQYDMAYFGYVPKDNEDGFETIILSGSETLEIHDVSGLDNESTVSPEDGTAGTDGAVTIYSGSDPPDPLANPGDNAGWTVQVVGGQDTKSNHPVGDVQVDGDTYSLSTTDLADGEAVENVRLIPPTEYTQPVEHVADATTVDEQEVQDRVDSTQEIADALDDGGDGFLGGGGLFGGGGIVGGVVLAALAVFGFGQLSG